MARSLAASASRRSARRRPWPAIGVVRPLAGAAGAVRVGAALVWRRRRLRIALLATLVALPLLGAGWLWLRDSPLVAVEHVRVEGVRGVDARAIEGALSRAGRRMTTLDVNVGALRAAVARFRVVRDLRVDTSFPHGLRIDVVEQLPAAALVVGGVRTAVAADGAVLGPGLLLHRSAPLPTIDASSEPLLSGHVRGAAVIGELRVLGAAPATLAGWVARVFTGPEGITVAMRTGLSIYFGAAARPHAKWLSAARVLADPSSAGATYVDVRLPERPAAGTTAAGGLAGTSGPGQVSASDPSAAALAAALAEAVRGQTGVPASAPTAAAGGEPPAGTGAPASSATAPAPAAAGEPPAATEAQTSSGTTPAPSANPTQAAAEEPSTSSSG